MNIITIKYLSENDASLNESMEIASEYGYEVANLSSEISYIILKNIGYPVSINSMYNTPIILLMSRSGEEFSFSIDISEPDELLICVYSFSDELAYPGNPIVCPLTIKEGPSFTNDVASVYPLSALC